MELSNSCDLKIVFWENETTLLSRDFGLKGEGPVKKIMLMLGPEGGFASQEIETARKSGFRVAGLGPRILRAETATLAACALVQYLYGDMGPGVNRPD